MGGTILIIVLVIFGIIKKSLESQGATGKNSKVPAQKREPSQGKNSSYIPKSSPRKENIKREQPKKNSNYLRPKNIKETDGKQVIVNYYMEENILDNIEFPEVLYASLDYMYVPDTLPDIDLEELVWNEIQIRSEANEK